MSATRDSTLADPQELIADLRRQLAEREAELAENQAQKEATAEVLQVINSSPGDLAPVFDAWHSCILFEPTDGLMCPHFKGQLLSAASRFRLRP